MILADFVRKCRRPRHLLSLAVELSDRVEQIFKAPQRIDETGLHRWRRPVSPAAAILPQPPAEIVIGNLQGDRSSKVLKFLAEPKRQAGEPFHECAKRQVMPLHMACAD